MDANSDEEVSLSIFDNGIGIPDAPEKLNHYGLAIMKERTKHLRGMLHIENRQSGGTAVEVKFFPEYVNARGAAKSA